MKSKYKINPMFVIMSLLILYIILNTYIITYFMVENELVTKELLHKTTVKNYNNSLTQTIGDYCGLNEYSIDKVNCVHSYVFDSGEFRYNATDDIIVADELMNRGGDCKSWSVFYQAIFNYMGIQSDLITIEKHVYVNVYDENFYCNVDQLNINCVVYDKE